MRTLSKFARMLLLLGILLLICILVLTLDSCKKEIDQTVYKVSGHLYNDCKLQPIAGLKIELLQDAYNVSTGHQDKGGLLDTTTTDANGYFEFEFKDNNGLNYFIRSIAGAGYNYYYNNIPQRKNTEDLVVYRYPSTTIQFSLNVINPHTNMDTLRVSDYGWPPQWILIPGPFVSHILYTKTNFTLFQMEYEGEQRAISYQLNSAIPSDKWFRITGYCGDTVKVAIDI